MKRFSIYWVISLLLSGCIGTDYRDDALREPALTLLSSNRLMIKDNAGNPIEKGSLGFLGLVVGEKQVVQFDYLNSYGVKENPVITWQVANPAIASVNNNEINALSVGSTFISATVGTATVAINLTVAANGISVATVMIASPTTTVLQPNQTVQLVASAKDVSGNLLMGKPIEWFTENAAIVTVSTNGLVTAVGNGSGEVHAKVEGVKSNSIKFNVGTVAGVRTGTFQSAGGYSSVGSVIVQEMGSKVVVTLSSNFQASVALGTFIYLANSTSGGNVKSAGLELGQWSSGAKTFDVPNVSLNQYKYVVVLCKPAGITFGYAELKP